MAQIGRVTNSLFSGVAEATLALANANFDFSLIKVRPHLFHPTGTDRSEINAPVEFEGVKKTLSTLRRDVAESGSTHITARKLGAIFEAVVPPTPKLYEAYGCRASEICQQYDQDERMLKRTGLFANFSGPDATSIWAAATSGKVAIAVHLLACVLARFWKPAEAISIWEEIISVRKKSLESFASAETFQMATVLASQVSLTRQQLAEWDNSARAWLGFADRARDEQQTKLKLVIDDIEQSIATKSSLYESIIDAWTVALLGMEELLKGSSQGVSHSGVILALASWHLYPNLSTDGGAPVIQNDKLFPHGTTLFLNLWGNPNATKRGIYWSLSLSHMRFYGAPVQTERSYATESSRISFTQFLYAVLGSTSSQWATKSHLPLDVARVVKVLLKCLGDEAPAWLKMLGVAAEDILGSSESTRLLNLKLYRVGQERGSSMLANPKDHPLPMFGLSEPSLFLKCLKSTRYKLMILRKYAGRFFPKAKPHEIILKVDVPPSRDATFAAGSLQKFDDESEAWTDRALAFQAGTVASFRDNKSSNDVKDPSTDFEVRLPAVEPKSFSTKPEILISEATDGIQDSSTDFEIRSPAAEPKSFSTQPEILISEAPTPVNPYSDGDEASDGEEWPVTKTENRIEYITASPLEKAIADHAKSYVHWSYRKPQSEACLQLGDEHHFDCQASNWIIPYRIRNQIKVCLSMFKELNRMTGSELLGDQDFRDFFFGDPESGAMFVAPALAAEFNAASAGPKWARKRNMKKEIDMTDIEHALNADEMDLSQWVSDIQKSLLKRDMPYFQSLNALSSAWNLYNDLGHATIDTAVLSRCVTDLAWVKKISFGSVIRPRSKILTRGQAFACIAEFETGGIDLASSEFESVMAISIGESIFVAGPLLRDPSEAQQPPEIIRLNGNVGKSGLVLMVPPAEPMVSTPDPDSWRVIEREEYSGQPEDCFSKTSLQLSFTDWSVPINTGAAQRGRRSAEASLVETLVSVFSYGKWIGDLDVLTTLRRGWSQPDHEFFYCYDCKHKAETSGEEQLNPDGIVAIRSWDEFLDRPNNPAVVMAHGNWEARLAATAMGVARGDRVFICRGAVCQECLQVLETFGGNSLVNRALFIA